MKFADETQAGPTSRRMAIGESYPMQYARKKEPTSLVATEQGEIPVK